MEGKEFYHLYLRGNNQQVIFYEGEDYVHVLNRLALAAFKTDTDVLAFCFLSNHFHLVVKTPEKGAFMHFFRMSLSGYFNKKYNCSGNVGTRAHGAALIPAPDLDGGEELRDIICYVLRNPLWHAVEQKFMRYPWSSGRIYFNAPLLIQEMPPEEVRDYLPRHGCLPEGWQMDGDGLIAFESYVRREEVEKLFGDYKSLLASLSVPSRREVQAVERDAKKRIKSTNDSRSLFVNMSDVEVSEKVLEELKKTTGKTIPMLTVEEKVAIAKNFRGKYSHVSRRQLARILFIPEITLRRRGG